MSDIPDDVKAIAQRVVEESLGTGDDGRPEFVQSFAEDEIAKAILAERKLYEPFVAAWKDISAALLKRGYDDEGDPGETYSALHDLIVDFEAAEKRADTLAAALAQIDAALALARKDGGA